MSYKNLASETLLDDIHVEMYNASNCHTERLCSMNCMTAGLLIDSIMNEGIFDSCVYRALKENFPREVTLKFNVNGKTVVITIISSISDNGSEWISVKPKNEIVIDSILFCRDLVTEINNEYCRDSKGYSLLQDYYSNEKAKSILIESLIEKFEEEQFYASDVFNGKCFVSLKEDIKPQSDTYKKFAYIPNYCLRTLIKEFKTIANKCGKERTVSTFLSTAAEAGMLKFKPYITKNSHGNTTLVLKYNRYVHLFRGYHYQCSYTADGIGEYSSAGVRLDRLSLRFGSNFRNSKLLKMFYYMNLISCCRELDVFTKLLNTDPCLVDKFMKESTKDVFDDYDVTYIEDMVGMVNFVSCGIPYTDKYFNRTGKPMLPEPVKVLRVPANDTSDVCRIRVYDTHLVSIEFWMDNSVQEALITLPALYEGYSESELNRFAEEEDMDVKEYIKEMTNKVYDSPESYYSLINFALNMCGYIANFMVIYPDRNIIKSNLRALNNNDVKICNSLNGIDVEEIIKSRFVSAAVKVGVTTGEACDFVSAIESMLGK